MKCITRGRAVFSAMICLGLAAACSGDTSGDPVVGDSSNPGVAGNAGSAGSAGAAVTYSADIQPILMADCSPCHSTLDSGGHDAASSYMDAVRVANRIVQQISSGNMPLAGHGNPGCGGGKPGASGCVSQADFALIESWIKGGTPE